MKKRVLAALLVTMMTVGTVAGCGSSSKSDDSDKKTTSDAKSDDKKDSGKKVNCSYFWNRRAIQPSVRRWKMDRYRCRHVG